MSLQEFRLPRLLLENVTDIVRCYDRRFIEDVARWLDIPARDIQKRLFGPTGGEASPARRQI